MRLYLRWLSTMCVCTWKTRTLHGRQLADDEEYLHPEPEEYATRQEKKSTTVTRVH